MLSIINFKTIYLCRVNIEIFGCLLKNAIVQKKCYFLVDLMNRAEKMNVTLNEKAIKLLDTFKRETTEAMAKYVSSQEISFLFFRMVRGTIRAHNSFLYRIEASKCRKFMEINHFGRLSRYSVTNLNQNCKTLKLSWNNIRGSSIDTLKRKTRLNKRTVL